MLFITLNREDFSFVIHLDRQPRTSRRREAQTGSRARSGSRSERTLDAVEHSRTLMEWWPFLIFHRGGLRIKVINNTLIFHAALLPSSSFLRMHSWHTMIQKVYEIDPLLCPFCGGEVKILSFIIKPKTIKKILDAMDLPSQKPEPLAHCRVEIRRAQP